MKNLKCLFYWILDFPKYCYLWKLVAVAVAGMQLPVDGGQTCYDVIY